MFFSACRLLHTALQSPVAWCNVREFCFPDNLLWREMDESAYNARVESLAHSEPLNNDEDYNLDTHLPTTVWKSTEKGAQMLLRSRQVLRPEAFVRFEVPAVCSSPLR